MVHGTPGSSLAQLVASFVGSDSFKNLTARTARASLLLFAAIVLTGFSEPTAAQTPSMLDEPVTQTSAGLAHTCLLTTAGAVKCWGRNFESQVGDNSTATRYTPVGVVSLGGGVAAISAGDYHSCALTTGGATKCWGYNVDGQLGDASTTDRSAPVDVVGLGSGVAAISAGGFHTCALTTAGAVKCWGNNYYGALGDNSTSNRLAPADVVGLGSGVAAISAGGDHTCALTTAGAVKCWGRNLNGQLGDDSLTQQQLVPVDVVSLDSGVTAISAGGYHTCALTTAGAVKCWGRNSNGQLGDNSTTQRSTPVDVVNLGSRVAAISAGAGHTCALTIASAMKCWGYNNMGQLGDNSTTTRSTPVDVVSLGSGVAAISTGALHTCAMTTTGAAKCWGNNGNGRLGDNSTTPRSAPVEVTGFGSGVAAISSSASHTCVVSTAGAARCWGYNVSGQLGDNSTTNRFAPVGVVNLDGGVAAMSSGGFHTCALTTSGAVKCWGRNSSGQLGDNSATQRLTPVDVVSLGSGVAAISAGTAHTCALTTVGAVKCWGYNPYGQLGDNSTTDRLTPVNVVNLGSGVAAIVAGSYHTCALTTAGAVKCWGRNDTGQLGDNGTIDQATPVDVINLGSGVAAISAGGSHTCALSSAGAVKCWGDNPYGQLGDNSATQRLTPVDVVSLDSGVASISAGRFHTCALTTGGAVKCWGYNGYSQLGDNSTTDRLAPVDVSGLDSGIAAINAGSIHTCALTNAYAVKCWGNNGSGQLGDNSTTQRFTPVIIRSGQSISFSPLTTALSGAALTLTATASSSLTPITFDTWTPTTCTVTVGTTLTLTGAPGSLCGVRASQPGAAPVPAGGSVVPAPQQLRLIEIRAPLPILDIDSSVSTTKYDGATDGVLLIRYLLGYRDSALVTGAISPVAGRNATQIASHIAANLRHFDVDGDGQTLALTDGIMLLRRLLGITNPAAITQGLKNSNRTDADVVLAIDTLKP